MKENVLKIVLNRVQGQKPNADTVFEQINNKDSRITHIFMQLLSTFKKRNTQYVDLTAKRDRYYSIVITNERMMNDYAIIRT